MCVVVARGRVDGVAAALPSLRDAQRRAARATSFEGAVSWHFLHRLLPEAFRSALTSLAAIVAACSTVAGL